MTNRKERCHSDIAGDYVLHFFEKILQESFLNATYSPPQAPRDLFGDMEEEEIATWNPNDPKIFEVDRSAAWLLETWKVYIRRKYKLALDRWNKETGGGNGQAWSFVNYCDRDARWLVALFLKDVECNYLLASNAGGRMPGHLQLECGEGVPAEMSSLEEDSGDSSDARATCGDTRVTTKNKKKKLLVAEKATEALKCKLSDAMEWVAATCKRRQEQDSNAVQDITTMNSDQLFTLITKYNHALNDTQSLGSMSPITRERWETNLKTKRKRCIEQMFKLED